MRIRNFLREDAEAVSNIIRRNLLEINTREYTVEAMQRLAHRYGPDKIREIAGYANMYVASMNDSVVGCGAISSYWGKEDESLLLTIFVLPEYHGRGIGRKIVRKLEKDSFFTRAKRIELHASLTACEFYRKMGYDFKDGIKQIDDAGTYKMEKFR